MTELQWFLFAMSPSILMLYIVLACSEYIHIERREHNEE